MKYATNKSTGNASFFDGKLLIPIGGYRLIPEEYEDHEDIKGAVLRGWIILSDTEPGTSSEGPGLPTIEFEKNPTQGSLYPPGKEPKVDVAAVAIEVVDIPKEITEALEVAQQGPEIEAKDQSVLDAEVAVAEQVSEAMEVIQDSVRKRKKS